MTFYELKDGLAFSHIIGGLRSHDDLLVLLQILKEWLHRVRRGEMYLATMRSESGEQLILDEIFADHNFLARTIQSDIERIERYCKHRGIGS